MVTWPYEQKVNDEMKTPVPLFRVAIDQGISHLQLIGPLGLPSCDNFPWVWQTGFEQSLDPYPAHPYMQPTFCEPNVSWTFPLWLCHQAAPENVTGNGVIM